MEEKIAMLAKCLINVDNNNFHVQYPRFCVTLEFGKGWVDELTVA
jgi:hypothetical protein